MSSTVWSTRASATPEVRLPRTFWRDTGQALRRQKAALLGLALVGLVILAALIGQVGVPESANRTNLAQRLSGPSPQHVLGTDGAGRDILQRVLLGAPLSLAVGVVAVAIGSVLGSLQGLIAGFRGGLLGSVIMRFTDAMLAFPTLLFALAIIATLGPGLSNVMIAVGLTSMPRFTRVMHAEVLSLRNRDYVLAARSLGATTPTILWRHILPNAMSSVLVLSTLSVSTAILAEATLSFLGLGPRPPTATWGAMISDGTSVLQVAPWVVLFPGLAITLTVLGFSLFGDGLRDALDVRLRDR
ncbi:MAG TPA: ABC transporter permease [Chloroflexota bacterium]|nr:ABC transporter permease [Chloroflexota bacterium]